MRKYLKKIKDYFIYYLWIIKGGKIPVNSIFKRKRILSLANKFKCQTFIESGTFNGYTVEAVKKRFQIVMSVEIFQI